MLHLELELKLGNDSITQRANIPQGHGGDSTTPITVRADFLWHSAKQGKRINKGHTWTN